MMNLSTRLESLKAELEASNTGWQSKDNSLFPLWALLAIYEKANHECYIEYLAGFKVLTKWLTPIATPLRVIPPGEYPCMRTLGSYETAEISKVLNIYEETVLCCLIDEVIPRMTRIAGERNNE